VDGKKRGGVVLGKTGGLNLRRGGTRGKGQLKGGGHNRGGVGWVGGGGTRRSRGRCLGGKERGQKVRQNQQQKREGDLVLSTSQGDGKGGGMAEGSENFTRLVVKWSRRLH